MTNPSDDPTVALSGIYAQLAGIFAPSHTVETLCQFAVNSYVDMLEIDAAAMVLEQIGSEDLQLCAASNDVIAELTERSLTVGEGPILDAYRGRQVTFVLDLQTAAPHWPQFAPAAVELGYRAVAALPMRAGSEVIGAIALHREAVGRPDPASIGLAQDMIAMTTRIVLAKWAAERNLNLTDDLQRELDADRQVSIVIGMLAERFGVNAVAARNILRNYARSHNLSMKEVAQQMIIGAIDVPMA